MRYPFANRGFADDRQDGLARSDALALDHGGRGTAGQVDIAQLLQALQCDKGQGYLFARPLPASAFIEFARTQARPQS